MCFMYVSEAYQRVATLQFGSNGCGFIAIFAAFSSATLRYERALRLTRLENKIFKPFERML